MKTSGKYAQKGKWPITGIVLVVLLVAAAFILIPKLSDAYPVEDMPWELERKNTPYAVTSILTSQEVEWAQATIWKETGVHLFLQENQITDIVTALNALENSDFEDIPIDHSLSIMMSCGEKDVLLQYDGARVGFVFDEATAVSVDDGCWSVASPELNALLDPILDLDNTREWVGYMTLYDIENIRLRADARTWDAFEDFAYTDIGTERYERLFFIDEDFSLIVGGASLEDRPEYILLVNTKDHSDFVDIRTGDIDAFLGRETVSPTKPAAQFYSSEQAMIDGCVVMREGDVLHNQKNWLDFVASSELGKNDSVRIVHYFQTDAGAEYLLYDLIFDGESYQLTFTENGQEIIKTYPQLLCVKGELEDRQEPYDSYIRYQLANGDMDDTIILYEDLIVEPDYDGITEIKFHLKQGEPPLRTYSDAASVDAVLDLLTNAEYTPCEPEGYILGVKLIMTNADGEELIIELDILQGIFRYGMQFYRYGELGHLLAVLGIDQWPEEVREEYSAYLT